MPQFFYQPTALTSMRVHGTAAQVEFPDTDLSGNPIDKTLNTVVYRGWGTVVEGYWDLVWVHFSIPTPKLVETDKALAVFKVFILFETTTAVEVRQFDLWDGPDRFLALDDLHLSGDFKEVSSSNSWDIDHVVSHSLGISVGVVFPSEIDSRRPERHPITFTGAGANFYTLAPMFMQTTGIGSYS